MKKRLLYLISFMLLCGAAFSPLFSQTYDQSTGVICDANYIQEYTFVNTPETLEDATLNVQWKYCKISGDDFGRLTVAIWIAGQWEYLSSPSHYYNGCQWVEKNYTLSAATINDAINSSGGKIKIRVNITTACQLGYTCNSDGPCFDATLTYFYAPDANFSTDQSTTCLGGVAIFSNESTGPQESYDWNFGEGAVPATANGAGPHQVYWTNGGSKDISLTVNGNGESSSTTKEAFVSVASAPSPIVFGDALEMWQCKTNGSAIQTQKTIIDAQNNLYMSGILNDSGTDIWITKIAADGTTIWTNTYTQSGNQSIKDILLDESNNIYLCGSSDADFLIMKVNADGSMDWIKTLDPSGNVDVANAICIDNNGNVYVTGATYANNGSNLTTAKYDNNGIYQYTLTETDNGIAQGADIVSKDGYIYIFGTTNVNGLNQDMILMKYEPQLGIKQWEENINGSGFGNDHGHQLILDEESLFLFGKNDQGAGDGWTVAKYDLNGSQNWKKDYFLGDTGDGVHNNAITIDQLGHLYLASTVDISGTRISRVLQLNKSDGSQNWSTDFSAINNTYFRGIKASPNGGVFVAAVTHNNAGNLDLGIAQLDTDGNELWWAAYDGCGGAEDQVIDLNVTSNDAIIISGYNIQAWAIGFGAIVAPAADFSLSTNSACIGETIIFSDESQGTALDYTWDFGAGASPATGIGKGPHQVTFSTGGNKNVSLSITNPLGNSTTDNSVAIHHAPDITTSGDIQICTGTSTMIQANGTGTITWDNGLGTGTTFSVSPDINTIYTATIIDENECSNTTSLTVSVNDLPIVNAAGITAICEGASTTLSASGANMYSWNNNAGTGNTVSISPQTTTTYTVTGTDGNGCQNTDQITVSVNDLPSVNISGNTSLCAGSSTTLTAIGANSYIWENGLGDNASFTVSPLSTTTYSVTGNDVNGCSNTSQVTVTINQTPNVNASGSITICAGTAATLTANGANNYTWNNEAGNGSNVTVSPSSTTTYTVSGTDSNGCSNTSQVAISVNPLPDVNITGNSSICDGASTTLTANGASSYAWNNGAGNGSNVTVSPSSTTAYTVSGTDSNGCSNTSQVTISVNPLPDVNITGNSSICDGASTTLTASGASSYAWDNGAGNGSNVSVSPSSTTTYTVSGTDSNGCSNTSQVAISVNPLPDVNITGNSSICDGASTTLTASGASSYAWDNGAGNNASAMLSPATTTTYSVTGTDSNGCMNTSQITVAVNSLPDVFVDQTDNILTAQNTNSGVTFQWVDCNNNFAEIQGATAPEYIITQNGDYAVVVSENGCSATSACFSGGPVGVKESIIAQQVSVYPNPSQGLVNIDLGSLTEVAIRIMTVNGHMIYEQQQVNVPIHSLKLNPAAGIYFVEIKAENEVQYFKVIVK